MDREDAVLTRVIAMVKVMIADGAVGGMIKDGYRAMLVPLLFDCRWEKLSIQIVFND